MKSAIELLSDIEYNKRTWKSEFIRKLAIWEEIAQNINSTKEKEYDRWCEVMDLHKKIK